MIIISDKEFDYIYKFVKDKYGINLEKKRNLIQSRLQSTLADKGFDNFGDYFNFLKTSTDEMTNFLNHITTNHTFFMREKEHFDFLAKTVLPDIVESTGSKNFSIWSAGCSSGEEAYTTVMTIQNFLGLQSNAWTNKILATDISDRVMKKAQNNTYTAESLQNLSPDWVRRFFTLSPVDNLYRLKRSVIDKVNFNYFNLMSPMPYKNKFDVVFCRNVMIYFDTPTRLKLVNKFYQAVKPGGYFFIGHSETITGLQTEFEYVKPSIYRKGAK